MKLVVNGLGRDHGEKVVAEGDLLAARIGDFDRYTGSRAHITPISERAGNAFTPAQEASVAIRLSASINLNGEYLVKQTLTKQEIGRLFAIAYAESTIEEIAQLFKTQADLDAAKLAPALLLNSPMLKKLDELNLSVRSYMCLKNNNIVYVGDLVQKTEAEMLRTKNFGRKSLNEIKEILSNLGLTFGMKFDAQGRLVAPPPSLPHLGGPEEMSELDEISE